MPPLDVAAALLVALRFALVAALLLPFAGRPSRRDLHAATVLSVVFGSLCFGLFFSGLRLGTAGLSAALSQLMTPFAILFAVPVLGERPRRRVLVGVAGAFGGVAVALLGPGDSAPPLAALLVAGGAAAQGLGTALLRRLGPVPPMRLLAYMSLFAAPQLALASVLIEHGQAEALHDASALAWASLAYATLFGGIAAFGLWFRLVGRSPLARVAPFALLQTPFGIAAGVLVLGEPPSATLVAGALVCTAGVALRGERVGRVSSEWFSRPADQRFLSLADLHGSVKARAERSRAHTLESRHVRVEARRDDGDRLSLILPGEPEPIAPVIDLAGVLTGLHRTFLDPRPGRGADAGRLGKAPVVSPRRSLGRLAGHGVRLRRGDGTAWLVGEGIETALSLAPPVPPGRRRRRRAVRVAARHPGPPQKLTRLVVARDNDAAGREAAERLAGRARASSVTVTVLRPRLIDFNAVAQRRSVGEQDGSEVRSAPGPDIQGPPPCGRSGRSSYCRSRPKSGKGGPIQSGRKQGSTRRTMQFRRLAMAVPRENRAKRIIFAR